MDFAGNEHLVIPANGLQTERATVQCVVVQTAQRQSVCNLVRPAGRHPHDMSCFQADQVISESHVEVADSTTVLVLAQDLAPESRVTPAFRRLSNFPIEWNAGSRADPIMQRLWEMRVQQTLCRVSGNIRVATQ